MTNAGDLERPAISSDTRLRELMDNVNDLILSVAPDGKLLFANRACYKTLGYAAGELSNLFQIIHPDCLNYCQTQFQRVLQGENLTLIEAIFVAKDGRRIEVEGSANCTFKGGRPFATNGIFRDVTAHKETEREQALLRFSIDRSMEGVARLDEAGVYTYMNPAHAAIYGYATSELIGKTWRELYPDEQIAVIEASYFPVLQREGKWRGVLTGRKKSSELFDVEISLTSIMKESGEYEGLLCTCVDATQRVNAERALRQSEQRFRSLFNSTYQFMGLLSVDGILLEANEPALLIGGLKASDVIGKPLWETRWFAISDRAQDDVRAAITQAAHGEFVRYEVEVLAAGDRTITVDFSLKPVFDDAGRVVQIIPEGRDITVKHELAQQLAASEQRLRLITDHVPALIGYFDREQRYQFANKSYETWFAIPREQVIGQTVEKLLGPQAYARAKPYIEQAFSGQTVSFENHLGDGRYSSVSYVPDRQGDAVAGIYTFVNDITERIVAAQSLYVEKERARTTLGSIGDGVVTINADGKIDYLNPVAEQLTGWTFADAEGMKIETVLHLIDQSDGKPIESPLYHALVTGTSAQLPPRTILISKTGAEYSVEDSCTSIRDKDGSITGAVLVFRDVTHKRKILDRITYQARHDALTGLVNRHEFELTLDAQLLDAHSSGQAHALLFIDLDHFKIINDTCGHKAGDQLLRQLAELMLHKLRKSDLLGRLGGDEFGVLLDNCQLAKAEQVAHSLINEIGALRFTWDDKTFSIGASIGVVPITRDSHDANSVFVAADAACSWAKQHGRNQVKVHRPDAHDLPDRQGRENWIERISAGLNEDRFCLYGQRISPTGHPQGNGDSYEVLLRLQEEDQQIVPPLAFLPAAERYSLMPQVDRWVIQHTFEIVGRKELLSNGGYLSINLSSASLTDKTLLDFIAEQLRITGAPPQAICFEISENAAGTHMEEFRKLTSALRTLGCQIALDNFASGLSSFPYLKNHPVDYLKIDGHFIKEIALDSLSYAMVDSINRIAHLLGIKTVAEAVESAAVLSKLEMIGIDYVQGYAVHEPQPIEQLKS